MQPKLVRKMLLSSCALLMIAGCASNRSIAQETSFAKMGNIALPSDSPLQPAKNVVSQINYYQANSNNVSRNDKMMACAHLWRNIQNLSMTDINAYAQSADPAVRGWFALARFTRTHSNQPVALVNAIKTWQQLYPNHPANQILPNEASLNAAMAPLNIKQIALLLPLSGPFGQTGQAIQNGFMTAYNAKGGAKPSVRTYDTNSSDVATLYQQAVKKGAELIIGPLTKEEVSRLISSGNINVPTIALNYTQGSTPPQLIEFGLSPDQAALQAAQLTWRHGGNRILAIVPQGAWGDNVLQNFSAYLETKNGQVIDSRTFDQSNMQAQVATLLKVQDSSAKHSQTEHYVAALPQPRKDANGIFLVANPVAARQIEPLFRYYLAGNLPIYSTSLIYNGSQDPMNNQDLNGTYFVDLPWILSNDPDIVSLRKQAQARGGANYTVNSRFYGLGVDTFILGQLFNRAVYLPNVGISGVTGRLYIEDKQQVYTQLSTARFINGMAVTTN